MKEARLAILQVNASRWFAEENETARQARLELGRANYKKRLEKEDDASYMERLQKNAVKVQQYRAKQTASEVENDRIKARVRMQALRRKRAALAVMQKPADADDGKLQLTTGKDEGTVNTSAEMSTVQCVPNQLPKSNNTKKERKRPAHKLLEANRAKFRKLACDGPSCVCASCHKLCYASHGTFSKDGNGVLGCIKQDVAAKATWFCTRCLSSLKCKKIPGTALENNMQVSEVPKELKGLNSLEERLISRVTPFMEDGSATTWTSEGHQLSHPHEEHCRSTAPSS